MKIFLYYFLIINLYGVFLMYKDKNKSRKGQWRVPEKKLFIVAIAFGGIGIFLGMQLFRHKTKHLKFVVGIPMIILIQLIILFRYIELVIK